MAGDQDKGRNIDLGCLVIDEASLLLLHCIAQLATEKSKSEVCIVWPVDLRKYAHIVYSSRQTELTNCTLYSTVQ